VTTGPVTGSEPIDATFDVSDYAQNAVIWAADSGLIGSITDCAARTCRIPVVVVKTAPEAGA